MNQMPTQIKEQGRTVRARGLPIFAVIIEDMREVRERPAELIDGHARLRPCR
jgi:hypothetical protein